ncbi:MAG: nitrile hydratase subunit alpha [Kiloniellales bacterium]
MAHEGVGGGQASIEHEDPSPGEAELLALAIKELLIEKGILAAEEVRRTVEATDRRTPELGRRLVARAWVDPAFKQRLLADGATAAEELGIDPLGTRLVVLENTPEIHNLVVCTLCSCYPRAILGLPPDWYKSRPYRSRAVKEPRAVLAEFGTGIPDSVEVRVHDSTADMRYLVLPMRPPGSDGMGETELARLVTRDCMIGVSLPLDPGQRAAGAAAE